MQIEEAYFERRSIAEGIEQAREESPNMYFAQLAELVTAPEGVDRIYDLSNPNPALIDQRRY